MADLERLWSYPMLPAVRKAIGAQAPSILEVLRGAAYESVRRRARERLEEALGQQGGAPRVVDESSALRELLSIPVSRMMAVALGERILLARLARLEARQVGEHLAHESDLEIVEEVARACGLELLPATDGGGWNLHMAHYVAAAPAETSWKLIQRPLTRGRIPVGVRDVARLCQESEARRIEADLVARLGKPIPKEEELAVEDLVEPFGPLLEQARQEWSTGDFGPVQPGLFPPCVKEIFAALSRNENVPHHGRFAFATFLHTVGWNAEQILDYLSTTPNFDREKSRYQIEHITGERGVDAYTPPGCATMQTNGVCPLAKRDGLCMKIKHPLSYYRARLRFQKEEAAALEARAEAAS